MRLIDADVLMESIRKALGIKSMTKRLLLPAEKAIIDQIESAPTVVGWICLRGNNTDVMPEDGDFVLVCNDEGKMMIAKYESEVVRWEYKYTNYDWDVWDDEEQGPVCYWMPLPEPPEVEEDD